MIRITVELVSANGSGRDQLLGVAHIANIGGTLVRGDYEVQLSKRAPKDRETWKSARLALHDDQHDLVDAIETTVAGFDRQRRGCWDLLYLALRATVGSRNR